MKSKILGEICRKCAECCKDYPFIELSQYEINELARWTGFPFHVFAYQKCEAGEEYFLKFKENGDCFFLNEDNGDYSCGVYEARSGICRAYPSRPRQNEVCNANREKIFGVAS
jgi:uncharacterized protein